MAGPSNNAKNQNDVETTAQTMHNGRQIKAPQWCLQNALSLTRAMVVRRCYMAATMAMALVQKCGGTPKIDVVPKTGTDGARWATNQLTTTGLAICTSIDMGDRGARRP